MGDSTSGLDPLESQNLRILTGNLGINGSNASAMESQTERIKKKKYLNI